MYMSVCVNLCVSTSYENRVWFWKGFLSLKVYHISCVTFLHAMKPIRKPILHIDLYFREVVGRKDLKKNLL